LRHPLVFDGGQVTLLSAEDGRLRAAAWLWQTQDLTRDPLVVLRDFLRRFGLGQPEQTSAWHTVVTTATADGAPLLGALDAGQRVLYAVGLGIYGPAWAATVAEQVAGLVLRP
jgi:glycine/D-amino acid oxidase-like deaminating enzyme